MSFRLSLDLSHCKHSASGSFTPTPSNSAFTLLTATPEADVSPRVNAASPPPIRENHGEKTVSFSDVFSVIGGAPGESFPMKADADQLQQKELNKKTHCMVEQWITQLCLHDDRVSKFFSRSSFDLYRLSTTSVVNELALFVRHNDIGLDDYSAVSVANYVDETEELSSDKAEYYRAFSIRFSDANNPKLNLEFCHGACFVHNASRQLTEMYEGHATIESDGQVRMDKDSCKYKSFDLSPVQGQWDS